MKRFAQLGGLLVVSLVCFFSPNTYSQNVTGIWKGYFIADNGQHYRLEFQVKQNTDGTVAVKGVSYSWQDDISFYGKATMTGSFMKESKNFRIKEIKTVEVKSATGGGTCIMNYDLAYSTSGKEEFLEGTYLGKQEVKGGPNPYEWGDCGGGTVYLRKVTTSEFYVEPFLRNRDNPVVTAPKKDTVVKTTNPPAKKPPVVTPPRVNTSPNNKTTQKTTAKTKPVEKTTVKTNPPVNRKTDSLAKTDIPVFKEKEHQPIATPNVLKARSNELIKSLVVSSPDVIVKLYDNGEIDDDTISIYYDKKLLLSSQRLSAAPIIVKMHMGDDEEDHELIMVAENLGRIPPNTALMIVDAGNQRFEVRITSTEQKNALVRFRYERPK